MLNPSGLVYIHGSESVNNSGKAPQFREWFPGMVTPAPALALEPLASLPKPSPISVSTVLIHGTLDTDVPLGPPACGTGIIELLECTFKLKFKPQV
jgi:hypothetical protein